MPFDSVEALKQSPLFQRMSTLHDLTSSRLSHFVRVFNAIVARAMRGGASEDEAEARAIPIALSAARKFIAPPAGRQAEEKQHVFGLMAAHMLHSGSIDGDADTDLTFPDTEDLTAAFAGNIFNHGHDPTTPMGIIHRFASRDELDDGLKAKIDPDVEVVAFASYFDDVPEDERLASISPEWFTFTAEDGTRLAVPHTFATTPTPANDPVLGIKQVASANDDADNGEKVNEVVAHSEDRGPTMSDTPVDDGLEARIASLEGEAKRAEALEKELDTLKGRIAAVAGVEEPENVEADAALTTLENRIATTERLVEEMKAAAIEAKADDFVAKTFEARLVTDDMKATLRDLYLKDAEMAEKVASGLPERALAPGEGMAIRSAATLDNKEAASALDKLIEGAF